MSNNVNAELISFIKNSPSCFHVVENIKNALKNKGFEELTEGKKWELAKGGKYYCIRNMSSVIAFSVPQSGCESFMITASHSDSPTFKIKANAEINISDKYTKINTEKYGGMLMATWLDRPLSAAGKIVAQCNDELVTKLVNVDRDLMVIPNVAIHMNREANDGFKFKANVDTTPLLSCGKDKPDFLSIIAESAGVAKEDVLGTDLYLYLRTDGSVWGADNEFVSSPKLDDLQCVFSSLQAFLNAENSNAVPVMMVADNEEVGSSTKQGAASTFLRDTLMRINEALGGTYSDYCRALAQSLMLSADNAHANHPNHPEFADANNCPYMNEGVVIKYNGNQRYATDSVSEAMFKRICKAAGVPTQVYANRSDMPGGSTLGNISNTQVPLNTVDIGLAQLAMHSAYETAGAKDTEYMVKAMSKFFNSYIRQTSAGDYALKTE